MKFRNFSRLKLHPHSPGNDGNGSIAASTPEGAQCKQLPKGGVALQDAPGKRKTSAVEAWG
jgi:hypothetical protein